MMMLSDYSAHGVDTSVDRCAKYKATCALCKICAEVEDTAEHGAYRESQEECARLREGVPYVKVYRYNPKHLCPKLNGYGDNGQRSLKL